MGCAIQSIFEIRDEQAFYHKFSYHKFCHKNWQTNKCHMHDIEKIDKYCSSVRMGQQRNFGKVIQALPCSRSAIYCVIANKREFKDLWRGKLDDAFQFQRTVLWLHCSKCLKLFKIALQTAKFMRNNVVFAIWLTIAYRREDGCETH
jgi:hypothetical protein